MMMNNLEIKPGTKLAGQYLIQEHLGQGGMGTVWLAKDEKHDDLLVATKLLLPELADDRQFINSMKEEAKNSMQLTHQNIVQGYGLHQDDNGDGEGVSFLVLKYIKGGTMKEVLQEWPSGVPLERVRRWAKNLASALDYAHANGVVHRDIKPSNIMIDADTDQAMLMDFGVSRQCDQTIRSGTNSSQTGVGTLAFMSPQQLHDKDSTSNDIYSLSAAIYKALSGRAPFTGDNIEEQILRNQPDMIDGVPGSVNRALLAGLSKDEMDRPESAEDLVDLLHIDDEGQLTGTNVGGVKDSGTPRNPGGDGQGAGKKGGLVPMLVIAAVVIGGTIATAMNFDQITEYFGGDEVVVEIVEDGKGESSHDQPSDAAGGDDAGDGGGSLSHDGEADASNTVIGDEPERQNRGEMANSELPANPGEVSQTEAGEETLSEVGTDDGTPDLFHVVRRGESDELAEELIKAQQQGTLLGLLGQIDPNTGYRLIHAAAASGRVEMVSAILLYQGDVGSRTAMPRQAYPIHIAAEFGHSDAVSLLIASGADVNGVDGGGQTALHLIAKDCRNQSGLELIGYLIGAGADVKARDQKGMKPADLVPLTSPVRDSAKEILS